MLESLARLIPCDAIGVVLRDASGSVVAEVVRPPGYDGHGPVPNALTLGIAVNGRHRVELAGPAVRPVPSPRPGLDAGPRPGSAPAPDPTA